MTEKISFVLIDVGQRETDFRLCDRISAFSFPNCIQSKNYRYQYRFVSTHTSGTITLDSKGHEVKVDVIGLENAKMGRQ